MQKSLWCNREHWLTITLKPWTNQLERRHIYTNTHTLKPTHPRIHTSTNARNMYGKLWILTIGIAAVRWLLVCVDMGKRLLQLRCCMVKWRSFGWFFLFHSLFFCFSEIDFNTLLYFFEMQIWCWWKIFQLVKAGGTDFVGCCSPWCD